MFRPTSYDFAFFSRKVWIQVWKKITSSQRFLTLAPKIHLKVILHPDRPKQVRKAMVLKMWIVFNNEKKGSNRHVDPQVVILRNFTRKVWIWSKKTSSQRFLTLGSKIELKVILRPGRPKKVPERYGSKNMNCFNNEKKGSNQHVDPQIVILRIFTRKVWIWREKTSSQRFLTLGPKIRLTVIWHPDRPKKVPERYGSKIINCFQ